MWWWPWGVVPPPLWLGIIDVDGMEGGSVQVGANLSAGRGSGGGGTSVTLASATGDFSAATVGYGLVITPGGPGPAGAAGAGGGAGQAGTGGGGGGQGGSQVRAIAAATSGSPGGGTARTGSALSGGRPGAPAAVPPRAASRAHWRSSHEQAGGQEVRRNARAAGAAAG